MKLFLKKKSRNTVKNRTIYYFIKIEVPQGTGFGPIMFLIYIKGLLNFTVWNISFLSMRHIDTYVGENWEVKNLKKIDLNESELSLNFKNRNCPTVYNNITNLPYFNNVKISDYDSIWHHNKLLRSRSRWTPHMGYSHFQM